jgi:hypothetical protein
MCCVKCRGNRGRGFGVQKVTCATIVEICTVNYFIPYGDTCVAPDMQQMRNSIVYIHMRYRAHPDERGVALVAASLVFL